MDRRLLLSVIAFIVAFLLTRTGTAAEASARTSSSNAKMNYPATRRVDHVDEYHGVKISDPYRWLEGDVRESDEVAAWVKQQNEVAQKFLDTIPERPSIVKRLTQLWNYERYSPPVEKGGRYFYTKN